MKLKYMMLLLSSLVRLSTRISKSCSNQFCSSCRYFSLRKNLKGMISQLIHKSFQRMINTNNKDIFVFWGFPCFFSSRNHLTTERHVFSLDLLMWGHSQTMTAGLQLDQFLSWEARVKENPDKEVNFLVLIKKKNQTNLPGPFHYRLWSVSPL